MVGLALICTPAIAADFAPGARIPAAYRPVSVQLQEEPPEPLEPRRVAGAALFVAGSGAVLYSVIMLADDDSDNDVTGFAVGCTGGLAMSTGAYLARHPE